MGSSAQQAVATVRGSRRGRPRKRLPLTGRGHRLGFPHCQPFVPSCQVTCVGSVRLSCCFSLCESVWVPQASGVGVPGGARVTPGALCDSCAFGDVNVVERKVNVKKKVSPVLVLP